MKIKLTTIYVDDQEKALRFYGGVLGFAKKADFSNSGFRWLTVTSPDDPNGVELQLAANSNPAGKAYQEATFQQGQPALMLYSDDVKATGEDAALFSANSKGACPDCNGLGVIYTDLAHLDPMVTICETCNGKRFTDEVLEHKLRGRSITPA